MERTNEEWLHALRSTDESSRSGAISDLTAYVRKALAKIVGAESPAAADDVPDFTQEALLRVVERLDAFRGDSAFTTWAIAIAVRVAFTELRRRRAREDGGRAMARLEADVELPSRDPPPGEILAQRDVMAALRQAIAAELTGRQRLAILGELRGLPTIEIAARLGTNQNALYKLVHDARKKLRRALLAAGFTAETIHEDVERGAGR